MFKRIFTNTLIYAIGPQLPKIASLFVLPIITKDLTTVDYGVSGIVMAYTGLLSGIKDLGIAVNMSNSFYKYPSRWPIIWRQLHGYLSLWSIWFTLIQAILLYFVIPHEASANRWMIILLYSIPSLFFDVTIIFGSRYFQLAQRPLYMATVAAIVGIVSIILNLVTISWLKMGYMGWFVSTFFGTFLSFLFYFFPLYFKFKLVPVFRRRKKFIRKQLRVALPTIPHSYSSYLLNTSDRIVMNVLGINMEQLGTYNLAYTFGNYCDFAGTAVGMAVLPSYTKLYSLNKEKDVKAITFFLQALFLAGSFIACLWMKEIFVVFVKNASLREAYVLAIVIIMGYNYRPMYWAVGMKLSFHEQTHHLWKMSFGAGIVNIILNFIFIPIYGFKVAAFTSFVGLMWIGFSGFFLKAYREMDNQNYHPLLWMIGITASSALVYLIKDIAVHYKLTITIFVLLSATVSFLNQKSYLKAIEI
jgi:O-antigen/teichoic acid export membrane protein